MSAQVQAADCVQISVPEVEDIVMRKLIAYIYSGDLGNTSKLALQELKAVARTLQLDVKFNEETMETPKTGKSARGKKGAISTPKEDASPVLKGRRSGGSKKASEEVDVDDVFIEKEVSPQPDKKTKGKKNKKVVEEEEYEVELIVDKREMLGRVEYLVKWRGWEDLTDRTWEPLKNLDGSLNLVEDYEKAETEKKTKTTGKRRSDIKFVHENGEPLSEADDSPKKKGTKAASKGKKGAVKETSPESDSSPQEKRGSRSGGRRSVSYTEFESPKGRKKELFEVDEKDLSAEEPMEEEYEVEKILDVRKKGKKNEYLVKWKGWEKEEDRTWEPEASLDGSQDLLREFNESREAASPAGEKQRPGPASSKKRERKQSEVVEPSLPEAFDEANTSVVKRKPKPGPASSKKRGRKSSSPVTADAGPMVSINIDDSDAGSIFEEPSSKKQKKEKPKKEKKKPKESKKKKAKKAASSDEEDGGDDEYEVEKIMDKKEIGGVVEYKVKWRGWDREEDMTWEPVGNLGGAEELIQEFEERQVSDDGEVRLCADCQRIFVNNASFQNHIKKIHKKARFSIQNKVKFSV